MRRIVSLYFMPDDIMLIVECPSGVIYRNQVAGVTCLQAEVEGVLAPFAVNRALVDQIMALPYEDTPSLTNEIADVIDTALASDLAMRFVRVDRKRLSESFEAWVHVIAVTQEAVDPNTPSDYHGSVFGFGTTTGVLTWPNSD